MVLEVQEMVSQSVSFQIYLFRLGGRPVCHLRRADGQSGGAGSHCTAPRHCPRCLVASIQTASHHFLGMWWRECETAQVGLSYMAPFIFAPVGRPPATPQILAGRVAAWQRTGCDSRVMYEFWSCLLFIRSSQFAFVTYFGS